MAKQSKVPVTMRALVQRINRNLAEKEMQLKKSRGRLRSDVGEYYVLDINRNFIAKQHVDPEDLGRRLGVLSDWEKAVDDA